MRTEPIQGAASKLIQKRGEESSWAVRYAATLLQLQMHGNWQNVFETLFPRPLTFTDTSYFLKINEGTKTPLSQLRSNPPLTPMTKQDAQLRKIACIFGIEVADTNYIFSELIRLESYLPGKTMEDKICNLAIVNHGIPAEHRIQMLQAAFQEAAPDIWGAYFLTDQLLLPHLKALLSQRHKEDDAEISRPGMTFITHSYGCLYSFVANAMAKQHLLEAGTNVNDLEKALQHFHQLKLGMVMPIHADTTTPCMPALYMASPSDLFVFKDNPSGIFVSSGDVFNGFEKEPFATYYDEAHPQRMMVVMKPEELNREITSVANVAGHSLASYLHVTLGRENLSGRLQSLAELQKAMLSRDPGYNFATNPKAITKIHEMLGAKPLSAQRLSQYTQATMDIEKVLEGMVEQLMLESSAWQRGPYPLKVIGENQRNLRNL